MYSDKRRGGAGRYWLCKCDCGGEKIVACYELRRGNTKTCGCGWLESAKKAQEANLKHGMCGTRLYQCYNAMKRRCKYEPNWAGRGIEVCDEWKNNPQAFFDWALANGYTNDLTLDRIDVNGNYEPSNCRWLSKTEQQYNKTTSHYIKINGSTKTLAEWSKLSNVPYATLFKRLEHGWDEKDLLKPVGTLYNSNKVNRNAYLREIEIDGETKTISEWSKISGLTQATIRSRIEKGWKGEQIIAPLYSIYHSDRAKNFNKNSL